MSFAFIFQSYCLGVYKFLQMPREVAIILVYFKFCILLKFLGVGGLSLLFLKHLFTCIFGLNFVALAGSLDDHMHLLLPVLIRLFAPDISDAPVEIQQASLRTVARLLPSMQVCCNYTVVISKSAYLILRR